VTGDLDAAYLAAARAVREAHDFEGLVRPLLGTLQVTSGYDSTYFSTIEWAKRTHEVRYAHNAGSLEIQEGLTSAWASTLSRRAFHGGPNVVADVQEIWGDNEQANALGVKGFASVPVTLTDGSTIGALCGASITPVDTEAKLDLFSLFSVLIGQAMAKDAAIAEERQRAAATESRLRGRLAAIAAAEHTLKTPLTVLQGWAMLFERRGDLLTPEQRAEGVEAIARNSNALRELVDRLLADSRADYRFEYTVHLRLVDLKPMVARMVRNHRIVGVNQTWTESLQDNVFARVDLASFEQMVGHLIDNASKYGGPGALIDVSLSANDAGEVTITIADTGPGMPDEPGFEPFARPTPSGSTDSVGIGLHVVKTLVDAHGARIAFSGNQPHGTIVALTFPPA
jgi:signal transduction histidine kinase